jgi:hypothetical protein
MICPRKGMLAGVLLALTVTPDAGSEDKADRIQVGTNVQASESRKDTAHYEVIIAADPKEAKTLVLASMGSASPKDPDLHEVATFTSSDGGNTWKLARVQKGQLKDESYFDPHLAYGADGSVYMVTMRNNPSKVNAGNIELARSRDGGKTWSRPTLLPVQDRPFLVTGGGKEGGLIACFAASSEPLVAISRDGGKSFTAWRPLLETGFPYGMGNGVRLSDGTLVVSYPLRLKDEHPCPVALTVARSTDGGKSYREAPTVARYMYHSDDGLPCLAADATSPAYKDRLYLVWPDHPRTGQRVWLARSQNRGETWSKPVLLSEQSGEGEAAKRYDSFLPAVAVNKTGVVGVMWYDSRDLPTKKRRAWNIRFRASLDGGETWLPSVRVTDRESLFKEGEKEWSAGDTAGLVADADGVFHAAWVDNRTKVRQIWTAAIRVESRRR